VLENKLITTTTTCMTFVRPGHHNITGWLLGPVHVGYADDKV